MSALDQPDSNRAKKTVLYGTIVILAIVAILLVLLRNCKKPATPPAAPPFDYFAAKAAELGQDPEKVAKFVREEVGTLAYHGNVKGALGALWNGAASPEEKAALAEALLTHCPGAKPVSIDGADPKAPICTLTITHRARAETKIYEGPIGDCIGDVHSIEIPKTGQTRFIVRAKEAVTKDVDTAGATFEEVVFVVQRPGREPVTEVRELWRKDNRTGAAAGRAGDRHDFVVLPCRVSSYVREKEELILKNRGRENAPEAKDYLALLDYARRSDLLLAGLEKQNGVRAQYDLPRILILSRFGFRNREVFALDLRLDRTTFEGEPAAAYLACEARSFVESGFEQHYLEEWSGVPSTSTFDLFARLKDDYPDKSDRRLKLAAQAMTCLLQTGGLDAQATFRALSPGKDRKPLATAVVTRDPTGKLRVKGGPVQSEFASKLASTPDASKIPYQGGRLDAPFDAVEDAAVAVETTLMASDTRPSVPADYVLDVRIDRGREPLVAPGATFEFAWGSGEARTEQRILVEDCGSGLSFQWCVQTGVRPAVGTRDVTAEAVAESTTHNPWYATGPSTQSDATSFCVSRRVYEALKSGRPCDFALQGRLPPDIEPDEKTPRPIEWRGTIAPAGRGTWRVKVNGREEELPVLKAKAGDREVAILDDPTWPIGMADKLTSVTTSVRGKLVDEKGLGIAGAQIRFGEETSAVTAPDGSFRLPPTPELFAKVKLKIALGNRTLGEPEVDLSAPGLQEVTLKVDRKRTELAWLRKENAYRLRDLHVSDQVKRQASRDIEAGRLVVIPNRMILLGATETIGYYALDPRTGDIRAVMEDGLCGASDDLVVMLAQFAYEQAKSLAKEKKSEAFAFVQMLRGAEVSFWVYCSYRLGGAEHAEAIQTMLSEMEYWAEATDLLTGFGDVAGKDLKGKMGDLMNSAGGGVTGESAQRAFKIGYLTATAYLGLRMKED